MVEREELKADIVAAINDKQQVTYNELRGLTTTLGVDEQALKQSLRELEIASAIASRSSGGILTYYVLQDTSTMRRVFVVEDDKNISRLMAITVGKSFDITQVYDGKEALQRIKFEKPDLVVLDIGLPGMDGLEVCQAIKKDPALKDMVVIIVSAMDATSNRFKGIKYGADYYIKKPFDPDELRSLVTIFLKKKGKKFDPLIDLPNEDKISDAVEKALQTGGYEMGRLRVEGLAGFASKFGNTAGLTILRLVSQLLQDKVKESGKNVFVGFLNGDDFVIAGDKGVVNKIVDVLTADFHAVVPFVYQGEGYKPIELGIEDIYGAAKQDLELVYSVIKKEEVLERLAEILKQHDPGDIGAYTYDELRRLLGSETLDITITRDPEGDVKLSVGKGGK